VAWIAPFAVFAAALLGTILLVRRWGGWAANAGGGGLVSQCPIRRSGALMERFAGKPAAMEDFEP
jgi:hypothetical protein